MHRLPRTVVLVSLPFLVASCSGGDDTPSASPTQQDQASTSAAPATPTSVATTTPPAGGYRADITRTQYGIPHIVADDWGSLGFGQGYAFAEDRACTLVEQVIKVRGERARWFGPGEDNAFVDSDFAYRHLGLSAGAAARYSDQPDDIAAFVEGYVAGFNAEIDSGAPLGWCDGQPWVGPITVDDLYAYLSDVTMQASSTRFLEEIATAAPPDQDVAPAATTSEASPSWSSDADATPLASNGWAIGRELSESGGGMLLANPHFPWQGPLRLWESQLTLTNGDLNVYGATLSGVPGVLIGFNDNVAWTHTVSAGRRFTFYELTLDPSDPTTYRYGDELRPMDSTDVTVEVLQPDGSLTSETRTLYRSHYGPMLNLPLGWTTEKAYALRDANADNTKIVTQFTAMGAATSMDDFIDAHRTYNSIPWVNTIAASADGRAWYADTSATPNLSQQVIAQWQERVAAGGAAALAFDQGVFLLDGSDPVNEWIDDPDAGRTGVIPFDEHPQLERNDYVFNANDSHWLANPAELLTGFSPLTGEEATPLTPRTRMNDVLINDPEIRGDDGLLSLEDVQTAFTSNRVLTSELLLKGVVDACTATGTVEVDGTEIDLAPACDVLRSWNGEFDIDAQGAVLWRYFVDDLNFEDMTDIGALWGAGFDPDDPIGTPNTLNPDSATVLTLLGRAVVAMNEDGRSLDIALGDLQIDGRRVDERIPLPGSNGWDGSISVISSSRPPQTAGPLGDPNTDGAPITYGNSFVLIVDFTDEGPLAEAVLTYGQPDDPASPDFTSQMRLYSEGTFRDVLFTPEQIAADPKARTTTVSGSR
jgi:acyl-homoserine-lactone acylase